MSYEKQTWATGDTITAAKLNHMEDGIGQGGAGGVLIETTWDLSNYAYYTTQYTGAEVEAMVKAGTHVIVHTPAAEGGYQKEVYFTLTGIYYATDWEDPEKTITNFSGYQDPSSSINEVYINDNGDFVVGIYVD